MKKLDKGGFHLAMVPLIVVIVAIIGFTGWYVWNSNNNTNKALDNISDSNLIRTTPTPTAPNPSPTPTTDITADWNTYTNTQYHFSLKYPVYIKYGGTYGDNKDPYFQKEGKDEFDIQIQNYSDALASYKFLIEADGNSLNTISFEKFVDKYCNDSEGTMTSLEIINSQLGKFYAKSFNVSFFAKSIKEFHGYLKDDRQQFYKIFFKNNASDEEKHIYRLIIASLKPVN
jgi:hypothetical protein